MKNTIHSSWIAACCVAALLIAVPAQAEEEAEGKKKGGARFGIGLSYASGMTDVDDFVTDTYEAQGYEIDSLTIPVGLSLVGGYRFSSGVEILGDVGPVSFILVDDSTEGETFTNVDVPLGLTVGYALFADKSISPYVRGGVRYHFSSGDFTESSSPGLYVAGGINFFSNKSVNLQLEVAYDASKVTYRSPDYYEPFYAEKEIEPGAFMVSVRAAF